MDASSTLIHGRWLVTDWTAPEATGVLEDGAAYQEQGTIVEIGSYETLKHRYPAAQHVGDRDSIVVPGFVNAHSHGRGVSTFQKGVRDEHLDLRVLDLMSRAQGAVRVDTRSDILWSCIKQMRSGITTTVHSHSYYQGSVDDYARGARTLLDAYRESGIRCVVALGIRDRNRFAYPEDAFIKGLSSDCCDAVASLGDATYLPFDEYLALLLELDPKEQHTSLQFGPTNPVWCSERLLGNIADASRSSGRRVHTHLAETRYQAHFAQHTYGKHWGDVLADLGLLSDRLSCAHAVWLAEQDLARLAEARAQVVHNPASNLRLSSGIAPLRRFLEHSVPMAFGTDSLAMNDDDDIFQDMRLAALVQNVPGVENGSLSPATLLGMATRGGAIVAGNPALGILAPGSPADIVLLSASRLAGLPGLEPLPIADWVLARGTAACVDSVMIGGRMILHHGTWQALDPERIAADLGRTIDAHARQAVDSIRPLKSSLRDYYQRLVPGRDRLYTYNDGK